MKSKRIIVAFAALILLPAMASAAVVEDWGDATDLWGGAISYDTSRVQIDTANNLLKRINSGSSNTTSSYYKEAATSPKAPDLDHWKDFDGNTAVRFTYTNTDTADHTWAPGGSHPDDYVGFCFQRYENSLEQNTIRWYFQNILGTVPAGESVTVTLDMDSYDTIDRSGAGNMYGWDSANGRIRLGGWKVRIDYVSYGSFHPYTISQVELIVPEPATVGLLSLGCIALAALRRRRKSHRALN